MGITQLRIRVMSPANRRRAAALDMIVDSGAIYSVVPGRVLRRLGIRPFKRETFTLADGRHVSRDIGCALFALGDHAGGSTVIFGQRGDSALIGAVTLEDLGLVLDPLRRQLRPLQLTLG